MKKYSQADRIEWHPKAWHIKYMLEKNIKKLELYESSTTQKTPYFYCNIKDRVGAKGTCGIVCDLYKPKNGTSGVCYHYGATFEVTNRIIIKLK